MSELLLPTVCAWIVGLAILICAVRLFCGPKLADRVVAIDLIGILSLALVVLFVHLSEDLVYLDVAAVLAIVAFLGTVIFARFLEKAPRSKKGHSS